MSIAKRETIDTITWWGIGLSILAANIAYDYIHVGATFGYTKGLALGSYEWTGSIFMIFVLLFILPRMMSTGVKTMPEYLGLRFNRFTRIAVAAIMVFLHIFVVMAPVLYSAGLALAEWYGLTYSVWLVICVSVITIILLFQNIKVIMQINIVLVSLMFLVGLGVMIYCFYKVGGLNDFSIKGASRINAFLSADDTMLPWHSVIFGGLWIAHAYYWSYNQFIQQFVLHSNTLSKAQFGLLFTATLKLIIPFIIIVPGITLYILNNGKDLGNTEDAFPLFISQVLPQNIGWFVLIVYLSTMLSTFSAVGFSCVTIVQNDLFTESFKNRHDSTAVYRVILLLFMAISFVAAYLFKPLGESGLLNYNQIITNAFNPSLVAIFTLGLFFSSITTLAANTALFLSIPLLLLMRNYWPDLDMLNTGGVLFLIQCFILIALSAVIREKESKVIPMAREIRFERNLGVVVWSILLITLIMSIYTILI